jgi:hypothetical protein
MLVGQDEALLPVRRRPCHDDVELGLLPPIRIRSAKGVDTHPVVHRRCRRPQMRSKGHRASLGRPPWSTYQPSPGPWEAALTCGFCHISPLLCTSDDQIGPKGARGV